MDQHNLLLLTLLLLNSLRAPARTLSQHKLPLAAAACPQHHKDGRSRGSPGQGPPDPARVAPRIFLRVADGYGIRCVQACHAAAGVVSRG